MLRSRRETYTRIKTSTRIMTSSGPWVGNWRPHKPRGPIAALYGSPGPKYGLPGLTGHPKHDSTKFKAPMFSFGIRHNHTNSDCVPGPKYLIPSNITRLGRDGTPAFSLHSRVKEQRRFQVPGPGQYIPECSEKMTYRSAPAFTLSGRSKDFKQSQTPGPAAYNLPPVLGPKNVTMAAAPTHSLYGRNKVGSFYEDLKKTPGPAAYNAVDPYVFMKKAPQFSMIGRNFTPGETTKKPGPDAYYPEQVTFTRLKAPSYTFGLRHSQYIVPLIAEVPE